MDLKSAISRAKVQFLGGAKTNPGDVVKCLFQLDSTSKGFFLAGWGTEKGENKKAPSQSRRLCESRQI